VNNEEAQALDKGISGVQLTISGSIVLIVNGSHFNVSRHDAAVLGKALSVAADFPIAPRFHICGAPNHETGHRTCRDVLGHGGAHSWESGITADDVWGKSSGRAARVAE
jgi:hypothetical protein